MARFNRAMICANAINRVMIGGHASEHPSFGQNVTLQLVKLILEPQFIPNKL